MTTDLNDNLPPRLPYVSVIIPVYNDNPRLQLCLDALAHQTYPSDRFEVIVVDNGSSPPVAGNVTGHANVSFLTEAKPGSFAARNTGLAVAKGDVLAFTDADCYPEPRWIEAAVAALADPRLVVAGRVDVFPRDVLHPSAAEQYEMLWGYEQDRFARAGVSVTANLVAFRKAFDEAGPFGTESHSGHDFEWCQRAGRAGYEVVYVHDAGVRTPARESFSELATKFRRFSGANYVRGRAHDTLCASRRWALLTIFKPPVRRLREAFTRPGLGSWRRRASICAILLGLKGVYAIEWVRMETGAGQAERR